MERSISLQEQQNAVQTAQTDNDTVIDTLTNFSPAEAFRISVGEIGAEIGAFFPWGTFLAQRFQQWYEQLRWPGNQAVPRCCRAGVTWLELAMSFSWVLGSALPITRDPGNGELQLLMIGTAHECAVHNVTLYDFSCAMQTMWAHFTHCLKGDQLPPTSRNKNGSLLFFGYLNHAAGLDVRPCYPGQDIVVPYLRSILVGRENYDILVCPPCVGDQRCWNMSVCAWEPLRKIAYTKRRQLMSRL